MEINKHLIIQLIIQDMKHEQLMAALLKAGFYTELHDLELAGVVAELMGIPEMEMSWEWCDSYISFLRQAQHYDITGNGKNLLPLAESCYKALTDFESK